jgi:phospholipid/cholesterol/gamma-HCH transport system substrate-binding protein
MGILRSHKLVGIVFLALMAAAVWFTYAIFTKQFADYDEVTLRSSKIGLQMPDRADVKVRGAIVGEVLDTEIVGDEVDITLGMYPDKIDQVPANVQGAIYPKTLFGEKYVELEIQGEPQGNLQAGDDIAQTRVTTEVEEVLSDLHPLLTAIQPAELNYTLNAMAGALEGRGDRIGENLEILDSYLKRMNPEIPKLMEDLRLTAETSDLYADVLPEIAEILRNSIKTGNTLVEKEKELQALFGDVTGFADVARPFLARNEANIVRLGELSAAQFRLLAKYAPEYPCLLGGIRNAAVGQGEAFRGFMLHINLELIPNQPRGYNPNDAPRVADKRGPHCGTLPTPPWNQNRPFPAPPNFNDGVDEPTGKGTMRVAPMVGTASETAMLKSLLAPGMGVAPEDVPDLGALLVAPMARGAEVSLR